MLSLKLDNTDIKILDFLQKDATLTAKELGHKLALSQTPIYERIKKLEQAGIIKSYVALLNADLLGKSIIVMMNLTVKDHGREARKLMVEELVKLEEISELYNTSGTYDFMAKGRFGSIEEYRSFLVDKLTAIDNINDIDSHIVLEELKYSTAVQLG